MKKKNSLIPILAIVTAIISYVFYMSSTEVMDETFLKQYGEFTAYEMIDSNPIIYRVVLQDNKYGYLVFNSEYGYQSDITMATLIDSGGYILDTKIYSENETKGFFERLYTGSFLDKNFKGESIVKGFSINSNVDGITGATVSSNAVCKAVHDGSALVGRKFLDINIPNPYGSIHFGKVDLFIILMFALVILTYMSGIKILRTITLIYSFIFMGLEFMQFISYSTFISLFTFNCPSVYENFRWYLLLIGSLIIVMSTGKNLYCTYICPFGAMQQMQYRFSKLRFFKVRDDIKKAFKTLPGFIAWLAFIAAMLSKDVSAVNYEPFSLVFGRVGISIQWVILPVIIFMALFLMGYYCKFGCPVGYTWNILLRIRRKVKKLVWVR